MESWSEFAYMKMMYLQFRGLWILRIFKYQTSGGTIFIPKGLKELLYVLNFYSDSERERKNVECENVIERFPNILKLRCAQNKKYEHFILLRRTLTLDPFL